MSLRVNDRIVVKRAIVRDGKTYANEGDAGSIKALPWFESGKGKGCYTFAYVDMDDGSSKRFRLTSIERETTRQIK